MADSGELRKKLIDPTDLSYNRGAGGLPQSANIVQAVLAMNVGGGETCRVLTYCKSRNHVQPNITQLLLRNLKGIDPVSVKTMAMGDTGYYLHVMGGKGAFAVSLTKGNNSIEAVYGYLEAIINQFYQGAPGNQGQFQDVDEKTGASESQGMRSMMIKWNGANILKTEKLNKQTRETIEKLGKTISAVAMRGEQLNEMLLQSEDLAKAAQDVMDAGKAVYCKMLWRFWKWIIMIIIAFLVLIVRSP